MEEILQAAGATVRQEDENIIEEKYRRRPASPVNTFSCHFLPFLPWREKKRRRPGILRWVWAAMLLAIDRRVPVPCTRIHRSTRARNPECIAEAMPLTGVPDIGIFVPARGSRVDGGPKNVPTKPRPWVGQVGTKILTVL